MNKPGSDTLGQRMVFLGGLTNPPKGQIRPVSGVTNEHMSRVTW